MAFRFGASPDALERDFGVSDVGEKVARMRLAHFFGWPLDYIDGLSPLDWVEAVAYINAHNKMESTRRVH